MKSKVWIIITIILLLTILVVTPALATGTMHIDWFVIGSGGGTAIGGDYVLKGTIGQPVVGLSSGGASDLCSGFWCHSLQWIKVFLPIIFGP